MGGVVEQSPLVPGQVQGLVEVGIDLELVGIPAQAEMPPPQLMHRDAGGSDGLVQQPGLCGGERVEHWDLHQWRGRTATFGARKRRRGCLITLVVSETSVVRKWMGTTNDFRIPARSDGSGHSVVPARSGGAVFRHRGQPATVIWSRASCAAVRRLSDIGAEPAASAAVCCPSSLITYSPKALARSAVAWESYCGQYRW